MKITGLFLLLALGAVGCSPSELHDILHPRKYHDSYNLSEGTCSTYEHNFEGSSQSEVRDQLCWMLQDSSANNNCAESSRRALFYQKCDGTFFSR